MPLEYPTYDELADIGKAAVKNQIPSIDPTVSNQWSLSFIESCAQLAHSNNLQIKDVVLQLFPQTATGEFLDLWLGYESLERTPARGGRGNIAIVGTDATSIPSGTVYTSTVGNEYETKVASTISDTTLSVSSLSRTGTTVTAVLSQDHNFATGMEITIADAVQTDYNGTFEIIVTDTDTFTYQITGSPVTPATGTITASATYASVEVECTTTGQATNVSGGAVVTIQTPITGAGTAIVVFSGLTGGADIESDDVARERVLLSRSIREGVFTTDQIRLAALGVTGNTRIYVINPELPTVVGRPEPGQVYVYFLRDNDVSPIPSATLIAETKQAIIDNGRLPGHTVEDDVVVQAPTPVTTDFTFSSITPNTATMQASILAQLQAFYEDTVDFETTITEASYLGAIQNTQDLVTGEVLQSFALTTPSANITISIGEIGFLGTVSFP